MDVNGVIAVCFGCIFMLSIVPIVGGFMHARRERLLTHTERMRALELCSQLPDAPARIRAALGQTATADLAANANVTATNAASGDVNARKCFSTALWVAFWGFAAAAGLGGAEVSTGVAYAIASSAGAIGVTAVICGTVLASRVPGNDQPNVYAKHASVDADELDFVSCRG